MRWNLKKAAAPNKLRNQGEHGCVWKSLYGLLPQVKIVKRLKSCWHSCPGVRLKAPKVSKILTKCCNRYFPGRAPSPSLCHASVNGPSANAAYCGTNIRAGCRGRKSFAGWRAGPAEFLEPIHEGGSFGGRVQTAAGRSSGASGCKPEAHGGSGATAGSCFREG